MGNCAKASNKNSFPRRGSTTFMTQKSENLGSPQTEKKASFSKSVKSLFGIRSSKVENETTSTDSLKNAIVTITYSDKENFKFIRSEPENSRSLSIFPIRSNKSHKSSYKQDSQFMKGNSIGRGLYGIVYNCLDAETGEIMALKIVYYLLFQYPHNNSSRIQGDINKFKDVFFQLNESRNIIKYFEFFNDENSTEILMEMVSGGSLNKVIQNFGKLGEPIVSFFTKQILEALLHIYSLGLLHRNLRLSNVLTESEGTIKLTDIFLFPFSQDDKDEYTGDFFKSKTSHFEEYNQNEFENIFFSVAPEIHTGNCDYTEKSDVWSIGCIVIELITGEPLARVISPILENDFSAFEELSDACKTFLKLCLNTNCEERADVKSLLKSSFIMDYHHDSDDNQFETNLKTSNTFSIENSDVMGKGSSLYGAQLENKSLTKLNTVNSEEKKDEENMDNDFLEEQRKLWEQKLLDEIGGL